MCVCGPLQTEVKKMLERNADAPHYLSMDETQDFFRSKIEAARNNENKDLSTREETSCEEGE